MKLAAIETTILNLQAKEQTDSHIVVRYMEEMAKLKSLMSNVTGTLQRHDQQLSEGISSCRPHMSCH